MLIKDLKENPLLFAFLCFLYVCFKSRLPYLSFLICILIWAIRVRDWSFLSLCIVLILTNFCFYSSSLPTMQEGKAVLVKENYSILENGRERVLVYTQEPLEYDAIYTIEGTFDKVTTTQGFFRFDAEQWAKSMGISYSIPSENIHYQKSNISFRSVLQNQINTVESAIQRAQLNKILLNMNTEIDGMDSFFEHGFSYVGILLVLNTLLKYFLIEKHRRLVMLTFNLIFILLYHFPMLLVQSFIFRILSFTKLNRCQQTCFGLVIIMIFFSESILSVSFLLPAIYRFVPYLTKKRKSVTTFCILCLQSIFFHQMNIVQLFLYPMLIPYLGFLWITGILSLWFPFLPFEWVCNGYTLLLKIVAQFDLVGSMVGFGCIFFIILCLSIPKSKYHIYLCNGLLILFQFFGLFHPFAEVSMINVGQGDSFLIRAPFQSQNILIDTGKPTQWNNLQTFLNSKGIRTINTLIITHQDNDHSGNQENVINTYHPSSVITTHQQLIQSDPFVLYDLNEISNEDENQSSIALVTQLNHLTYLFMGDCDAVSEEAIARKYANLHCDVLKLSHHGSKTGSSSLFLDVVQPKLGLISSGAYKIYHHPSPETIQRLLQRHIPYFDTKEEGDVTIFAICGMNLLVTSSGFIGIIG